MSDNEHFSKKRYGDIYDDLWGEGAKHPASPAPDTTSPGNEDQPLTADYIHDLIGDLEKNLLSDRDLFPGRKPLSTGSATDHPADEAPSSTAPSEKEDTEQSVPGTETSEAAASNPEEETDPMEDLNALVGLEDLKKDVDELISLVKMQKMRKDQGLKSVPVSLHLVFSGNPGTGKTTVARILARLYRKIGVLSKGQLVETDRSGLVAGYVGQTATKTMDKINEAMGGILFIDEAYTLNKEGGNDFGQEAIDTILKAMEDHRDEFVVIVAGYTELMEQFVNSNPGLKSRFNKYLFFKDYTAKELLAIFRSFLDKYEYTMDEDAEQAARELIEKLEREKTENFANAREVRNLFEKIITRQALRIGNLPEGSEQPAITLITKEDVTGELPDAMPEPGIPDSAPEAEGSKEEASEKETPDKETSK